MWPACLSSQQSLSGSRHELYKILLDLDPIRVMRALSAETAGFESSMSLQQGDRLTSHGAIWYPTWYSENPLSRRKTKLHQRLNRTRGVSRGTTGFVAIWTRVCVRSTRFRGCLAQQSVFLSLFTCWNISRESAGLPSLYWPP